MYDNIGTRAQKEKNETEFAPKYNLVVLDYCW